MYKFSGIIKVIFFRRFDKIINKISLLDKSASLSGDVIKQCHTTILYYTLPDRMPILRFLRIRADIVRRASTTPRAAWSSGFCTRLWRLHCPVGNLK
jgi:hypothetical protein